MANTVEVQTLVDGPRKLIVHVHLDSDGVSGELSAQLLIDASTYTPAFTSCYIESIKSNLVGFSAELLWDATTDKHAYQMPDYEQVQDFREMGGIPNNAGAGKTGDINITTTGFTAAGDSGHIVLTLVKTAF